MHVVLASALMVLLSAIIYVMGYFACPLAMRNFVVFFLAAILASLLAGYAMRAICNARFGGLTGDNLGCIHEISEIVILLTAVSFL